MKVRLALVFTTLFIADSIGSVERRCTVQIINELVDGHEVQVEEISGLRVNQRYGTVARAEVFGSREDIIIAFDDNGHTYDNLYDVRHDGHHLGMGKRALGRVRFKNRMLNKGNYIKLENISKETKDKLYEYYKSLEGKKLRQTSCIRSTCKILEEGAGIKINGRLPWLPSNIFKKIIKDGFVDEAGNPVEYTIYRVEGKTLQQTLDRLNERQLKKLAQLSGAIMLVVVGNEIRQVVFEGNNPEN